MVHAIDSLICWMLKNPLGINHFLVSGCVKSWFVSALFIAFPWNDLNILKKRANDAKNIGSKAWKEVLM